MKNTNDWLRCPMTGGLCIHCIEHDEKCLSDLKKQRLTDRLVTFLIGCVIAIVVLVLSTSCASLLSVFWI
jgi:hypothetical protein